MLGRTRRTSVRVRAAASSQRCPPRPVMRPLALAALGLLLSLLLPPPPGAASSKPTPCTRCRELVDKFNQVGRALRDTEPGTAGPGTRTRSPRDGLGSPRHGPRVMDPGSPPAANGITTIWTRVAPAIGQGHP